MDTTKTTQLDLAAFTEEAIARVRGRYTGCEVKTVVVDRNNGCYLTGLIIQPKDSDGEISLLPTAYLNELYREYQEGTPMDIIATRFAAHHEATKGQGAFLIPDILHFDEVRDTICFRLVSAALNEDYLKEIPHRRFLDLVVVYCVPVTGKDGNQGIMAVTNDHIGQWRVDEETIHACAVANTERLYPAELKRKVDILRESFPEGKMPNVNKGLYVLRNRVGNGGAGAMFYKDILRGFADAHGDFYIVPSSIHEVLLLPLSHAPEYVDKESLPDMVRQVNKKNVPLEAVLSDNAYLFHAETGEIEILS